MRDKRNRGHEALCNCIFDLEFGSLDAEGHQPKCANVGTLPRGPGERHVGYLGGCHLVERDRRTDIGNSCHIMVTLVL